MKIKEIKEIKGIIEVKTGLHIGGSNDEIKIGGIDNPVIKNPLNNEPYIPGSSLKGKIRTLLEWQLGTMSNNGGPTDVMEIDSENGEQIVKLFGNGKTLNFNVAKVIGPSRISFGDCKLTKESKNKLLEKNALTEEKVEVRINRLTGTVDRGGPRHMERVPAGAEFEFSISLIEFEEDKNLENLLALGMKLLEVTNLGGSGSRGYGKIKFKNIEGLSKEFLNNNELKSYEDLKKLSGI